MIEEIKLRTSAIAIAVISLIIVILGLALTFHNMKCVNTQVYVDTATVFSKTYVPDRAPHYLLGLEYEDDIYQSIVNEDIYNLVYIDQKVMVQVVDYITTSDNTLMDRKVDFYEIKED